MFYPGETVIYSYVLPFAVADLHTVILSYKQKNHVILEKEITSGFQEEEGFAVVDHDLSQAEALMFEDDVPFTVQVNVYTNGGSRHVSSEIKETTGVQYHREVITGE